MSIDQFTPLTMPKWGMAMASGTVVEWLVEAGASVAKGDEILEIETDKTIVAMEAPGDGKLSRQVAQPGDELPVGALLGVLTEGEADEAEIDVFVNKFCSHFIPQEAGEEVDLAPSRVEIQGISIAYRKYPAAENSNGLPILFIHGFGGDQNGWMFNASEFSQQHTAYTFDLPAHGESSRQVGRGTLSSLASLVADFMVALAIPRAHIVGHSLGAAIAVELAAQNPQRVASLVLLSGAGAGTVVDKKYVEGFIAAQRRPHLKPYIHQLFADPKFVTREMIENVLKAKRIEGTNVCLGKIAEASVYSVEDVVPEEKLSQMEMPVLVIWGGQDQVAPPGQTVKLPANTDLHVFEQAGHMVHIEAASELNTMIRKFLENH